MKEEITRVLTMIQEGKIDAVSVINLNAQKISLYN